MTRARAGTAASDAVLPDQTRLVSHAEAEATFRGDDTYAICSALAAAALTDWDRTWLEKWCVSLAGHEQLPVRQISATCLGHLARRFRQLDQPALNALQELRNDPAVRTYAEDALEDVRLSIES
jgi:hypothetical protein